MNTATLDRASQLEYATITVQFVNPKKDGQRNASIKDVDGLYFWIKPEEMPRYQPGVSYEISYVTTQSNGYTNRTIKSAEAVVQRPAPTPQRAQPAQAARGPVRQSDPIEQPRQEPPRPQPNGNGGQFYRPTSPKDARRMFICSQMNALITSHQVQPNAQSIADAIAMLSDAYDMTLGQEDQA